MAYGVQLAAGAAHDHEVDREPAERAQRGEAVGRCVAACSVIVRAYSGAAGNVQPR